MKIVKLKINIAMYGYAIGQEVSVETDSKGTPFDKYWRRRLKDSEIDNCLEVMKPSKPRKDTEIDNGKERKIK